VEYNPRIKFEQILAGATPSIVYLSSFVFLLSAIYFSSLLLLLEEVVEVRPQLNDALHELLLLLAPPIWHLTEGVE